jgi:hypothetical protein
MLIIELRSINVNILIIGNGFDLAHGLPTKYEHFLSFLKIVKLIDEIYFFKNQNKVDIIKNEIKNEKLSKALSEIALDIKTIKNIFASIHCRVCYQKILGKPCSCDHLINAPNNDIIKDNKWVDYFLSLYESTNNPDKFRGDNWIDIEFEIQKAIKSIDEIKEYVPIDEIKTDFMDNPKIEQIINRNDLKIDTVRKRKIVNRLENDLDKFIQSLEQYMLLIDNMSTKLRSPDIQRLEINKVLSFNYTNTYEKYYGKDFQIEYNYIHGYAGQNNIILGFNEYLKDDQKNENLLCIRFKKYFQRIYKKTGCVYKKWFSTDEKHNVYIFGHSLDVTDKDVLNEIIMNKNVRTTIFYHDEETHARQIANLVKIIKQDTLIEKVYSEDPQIEFKQQLEMKQ